jgi:hypothetical protein
LSDNVYYTEHTGTATDDHGFTCDTIPYAKGVWFTYTALQTGTLSVDCCPSDFDTKLEVLGGSCGALTSIQCSDDACGLDQLRSQLSIAATCGTTYYICAGGFYDSSASGNLQIRAVLTNPRPNPRPTLAIGPAGTNVVISWPASFPCFTLYSATNLPALPADWAVVSPPPVIVSGKYTVTNAVLGSTRFYRLQ